jgi:hypothetical protein
MILFFFVASGTQKRNLILVFVGNIIVIPGPKYALHILKEFFTVATCDRLGLIIMAGYLMFKHRRKPPFVLASVTSIYNPNTKTRHFHIINTNSSLLLEKNSSLLLEKNSSLYLESEESKTVSK